MAAKLFAHYVVWFPVSIDNKEPSTDYYAKNYLLPTGESGKHASYYSYLRDRPKTRAPRPTTPDWKVEDLKNEIAQAKAAGFEGFMVDVPGNHLTSTSWQPQQTPKLLQAADAVGGFTVGLMIDMNGEHKTGTTPAALANMVADLAKYKSAHRLDDGRLVVSPYMAENWTVSKWQQFFTAMKAKTDPVTGKKFDIAFVPCFLNFSANYQTFASICYGFGVWGNAYSGGNSMSSNKANADKAHALGKIWMQPVRTQDSRPKDGVFWEASNFTNMMLTYQAAIAYGDWAMVATWNDYAENSHIAPSEEYGSLYCDVASFYNKWFLDKKQPVITKDAAFLSHRKHFVADRPKSQTKYMTLVSYSNPATDLLAALVFLTDKADVTVTSGSNKQVFKDVPAGVSMLTVPLGTGAGEVIVQRTTVVVTTPPPVTEPQVVETANVDTKFSATHTPVCQDMRYVIAGSGRTW